MTVCISVQVLYSKAIDIAFAARKGIVQVYVQKKERRENRRSLV